MIEYKLESGKLVKVKPEHEQQFLQKYPTATLVSGNQESPAGGAPTGQETAAPVQEVVQPQNNTDSNLEVGSLGSLDSNLKKLNTTVSNTEKRLKSLKSSMGDAKAFNNEALYNSIAKEYNTVLGEHEKQANDYNSTLKQYKAEEKRLVDLNEKPVTTEKETSWVEGLSLLRALAMWKNGLTLVITYLKYQVI